MKVLLDTNIVIDIISARQPFFQESYDALKKILTDSDIPCIAATSVTDIVYILRKYIPDQNLRFQKVQNFLKLIEIEDTKKSTVEAAFLTGMNDYEDSVQFQTSVENSIKLVITRTSKDFTNPGVDAKSPADYIRS